MAEEIRADYQQLQEITSRFNNQSQAIQEMLQRVRNSMSKLEDGGWIGRGSDAFFNEMNGEVLPAVERLRQALEEAARATSQIAQIMRQAEEEASARFQQYDLTF
ncbi:MAG TPA: WXG100 family type VII secretion target [Gammaproteobacteria bacterium]|nr:WXG100 family type VII secretion target [Gammaproteobacteria bacterium]